MTIHRNKRHRRCILGRLRRCPGGIAVVAAVGGLFALNSCTTPESPSPTAAVPEIPSDIDFTGRVTRIVDGDTFWVASQNASIRVWGLDAPETDQLGGSAATGELARLIADQTLQCRQRDIDRYGRIVGQCFLANGRDITAAMIASGTAQEYCRFSGNYYRTC